MSILVGESYVKPQTSTVALKGLVFKAPGLPSSPRRRGPTIVPEGLLSNILKQDQHLTTLPAAASPSPTPRPRPPDARERRASRSKEERQQRQRANFTDAAAFAYFNDWPLNMRITVTWDVCTFGDRNHGHILGKPDKERCETLRSAIRKRLRKQEEPFACICARDTGGKRGQHIHLALYWPLPLEELVWLLSDLTGSLPSSGRLPGGVVAQSECHGWQIKRNTALEEIPSALRWAEYLLGQEQRHLIMPSIEGKLLGVSRDIGTAAMMPHREKLEDWKRQNEWRRSTDDLVDPL